MDWQTPSVPAKFRKLYEQAHAGKAKAAIRCHCLMCVGWEPAEVERCTATGCPLFMLRSLTAQAESEAPDRAKRRERALAGGHRPPKRAAMNGHGAQEVASISSAAEVPCALVPPHPVLTRNATQRRSKGAAAEERM
jgi:hypothetical protein